MNELTVQITNGYNCNLFPNSISFHKIEIEPEKFNLHILDRQYPLQLLRDIASKEIAKQILAKLKYECEKRYDGQIVYKFSVSDYSILESKEKKKIINNLEKDNTRLSNSLEKARNEYNKLQDIFNYNNRTFIVKVKDWFLYDKLFNKKHKIFI